MLQQSSWTSPTSDPPSFRSNTQQQFLILLRSCCCCCRLLHQHQLSLRMDVVVPVCVCVSCNAICTLVCRLEAGTGKKLLKIITRKSAQFSCLMWTKKRRDEGRRRNRRLWRLCSLWQRLLMAFPQNTSTEHSCWWWLRREWERERQRESAVYSLMHC